MTWGIAGIRPDGIFFAVDSPLRPRSSGEATITEGAQKLLVVGRPERIVVIGSGNAEVMNTVATSATGDNCADVATSLSRIERSLDKVGTFALRDADAPALNLIAGGVDANGHAELWLYQVGMLGVAVERATSITVLTTSGEVLSGASQARWATTLSLDRCAVFAASLLREVASRGQAAVGGSIQAASVNFMGVTVIDPDDLRRKVDFLRGLT